MWKDYLLTMSEALCGNFSCKTVLLCGDIFCKTAVAQRFGHT